VKQYSLFEIVREIEMSITYWCACDGDAWYTAWVFDNIEMDEDAMLSNYKPHRSSLDAHVCAMSEAPKLSVEHDMDVVVRLRDNDKPLKLVNVYGPTVESISIF
tara:strand:- start:791 stop:1102 length:312 start_codon:yes stop_codon:yes gene_type:complete